MGLLDLVVSCVCRRRVRFEAAMSDCVKKTNKLILNLLLIISLLSLAVQVLAVDNLRLAKTTSN